MAKELDLTATALRGWIMRADADPGGASVEELSDFVVTVVTRVCEGGVGAIFCLEASYLARNGRDWNYLLELCGLVGSRMIDAKGVYDPRHPNDRLLLGLKGTMREFERTVMRQRLVEGAVSKARRGELRVAVPVGYVWSK